MKKIIVILLLSLFAVGSNNVLELTDKNYLETLQKHKKVVIMFSADWCDACKNMAPIYEKVSKTFSKDIVFAYINTAKHKVISESLKIDSIPTTILYENTKIIRQTVGGMDKQEINLFVDDNHTFEGYKQKCIEGDNKVCIDLAVSYELDRVVPKNYTVSRELYAKACSNGSAKGCNYLAYMYDHAMGVTKDANKMFTYYHKACDGNVSWSCNRIALIYRNGYHDVKVDTKKSTFYFEKACLLGEAEGCFGAAVAYDFSLSVKQDYAKSLKYYTYACDHNYATACYNLGVCYERGKGAQKDVQKAKNLYIKACKGEDVEACANLGYIYYKEKNYKKAIDLGENSCDASNGVGCRYLGFMYRDGLGVQADLKKSH